MLNGFHLFLLDKLLNKLLDNIQTNRLTQIRKRHRCHFAFVLESSTTWRRIFCGYELLSNNNVSFSVSYIRHHNIFVGSLFENLKEFVHFRYAL